MRFSSKEDIEAPISDVFAMLSEFETYERSAIRRGVELRRLDEAAPTVAGLAWEAAFTWRGRARNMRLDLVTYDPPNAMWFEAESEGLDGAMTLDLLALSPRRTRLAVALILSPKTLSSRLLVQSLKLAKTNLTRRFKLKVADYAKGMEERHRRTA